MKAQLHRFRLRHALAILLALGSGGILAHAQSPLLAQKVRVGLLLPLT
jgi:hypothetical protein